MKGHDTVRVVRGLAAVVLASLALVSCRESQGLPPEPTVPTAPSTTPTTAPIDVSVIPPVIDEGYVNAVLAALDEVDGQAARIIVAAKNVTPEAADLLNAIYSDDRFGIQVDAWYEAIGEDPQLTAIRPNPGNRKTTVRRLIGVSADCVWMAVERDHSANSTNPVPVREEYMLLRPLDRSNDPNGYNPTAWMITAEGARPDGSEPPNQCEPSP